MATAVEAGESPRAGGCALVLALVFLPCAFARAETLRVNAEELPCPARERIVAEIEARVADLMKAQPDLTLAIRPVPAARLELSLRGEDGSGSSRSIRFESSDCADLGQTAALIVRGWVVRRWAYPSKAPAADDPEPGAPRSPVTAASRAPEDRRGLAADRFRLELLGSALVAPAARQAALGAQVGAEWSASPPWGWGLRVGRDGAFVGREGRGTISAAVWTMGPTARWTPPSFARGRLDLLATPALVLVSAGSEGYGSNKSATVADAALLLAARWRQPLGPRLWAVVAAELGLHARETVFSIANVGPVLVLSPVRARAAAGLVFGLD